MKKPILVILAFLVFALGARAWWACNIHDLPDAPFNEKWCCASNETLVKTEESTVEKTLALTKGSENVLNNFEQFRFQMDSHEPLLSKNNQQFLKDVSSYLNNHPTEKLLLTGFYGENEKVSGSGFYENIGIARTASVRDILVKDYAVEEAAIILDAEKSETSPPAKPMLFSLGGKSSSAQYEFSNMTFSDANFEPNSHKLIPTEQFVHYVDSLSVYLKSNEKTALQIIGHTDTDGDDKYNTKLGLKRAESTKAYLRKKGIKNPCLPLSKGETEPVADNDTNEGKAKNRRINIRFK
jgi:OmpA-OmpF porin, OOP family